MIGWGRDGGERLGNGADIPIPFVCSYLPSIYQAFLMSATLSEVSDNSVCTCPQAICIAALVKPPFLCLPLPHSS